MILSPKEFSFQVPEVHLDETFHFRVTEEQKHPPKVLQMKHFSGLLIIKKGTGNFDEIRILKGGNELENFDVNLEV